MNQGRNGRPARNRFVPSLSPLDLVESGMSAPAASSLARQQILIVTRAQERL